MLPPEKLFYTIGEVSRMLNVSTSTIRFWENEFEIIQPKKNKKGNRLFRPQDVKNLRTIYHLLKERGFTLQGAKSKLQHNETDTVNKADVINTLNNFRVFLDDLKNAL
jgi:DNA-binding transcriptional MerR regulator